MDAESMQKFLSSAYEKALNGVPGLGSAEDLADDYMKGYYNNTYKSVEDAVDALIRWQNAKCATSGFLTGVGGLITLPVAIPANIASVLYVQMRMIAAIAHMGGYDVRDDRVQTMVYACLCGNSMKEMFKDVGIQLGKQMGKSALQKIPSRIILKINQAVGFRLLTKFGQKGTLNLVKGIPLLGGVIGGTIDGVSTNIVGNNAKKIFIQ